MKRLAFVFAVLASFVPAAEKAAAQTEVSIDLFYDTLGSSGNWVEVGDYGYIWQPAVAVSNRSWRPYSDGYWAYTDLGWTWVSYEDFGWATYHYGRWVRLRDRGWFWVPGYEWAPAWVSWRSGGDYIGWAPLPPRRGVTVVYDGRPIRGAVDVEFDIGPLYYNFIDIRYIGEPVLRDRIFEPAQNVTYIQKTVNVTNITYNNTTVYNYGPDYNKVSAYSARPIQRLKLERQNAADLSAAAQNGALTKVQGDRLVVAAPQKIQRSPRPVAPKAVKEKIAQPAIEHGWSGAGDEKTIAQLKQKIKAEDPKKVPPPEISPRAGASTTSEATAPAIAATPPATANQPAGSSAAQAGAPATAAASTAPASARGKAQGKRSKNAPAPAARASSATPPTSADNSSARQPAATPATPPNSGKGRGHAKGRETAAPAASSAPERPNERATPDTSSAAKQGNGREKTRDREHRTRDASPSMSAVPQQRSARGGNGRDQAAPVPNDAARRQSPSANTQPHTSAGKQHNAAPVNDRAAAAGPRPQQPQSRNISGGGHGQHGKDTATQPPMNRQTAAPPAGSAAPQKGQKQKQHGKPESSPSPTP